jgi:hypothetical protein
MASTDDSRYTPEVEGAYDPAGLQKRVYDDAHDAVVVAPTHWGIGMRHNNAPLLPRHVLCSCERQLIKGVWMIEAAVEWDVIVDGGYREAIMSVGRAMHDSGSVPDPLHVLIAWPRRLSRWLQLVGWGESATHDSKPA